MVLRIAFFYEAGNIPEIGTGHKYRANVLADELRKRGHEVFLCNSRDETLRLCSEGQIDVLVIDHMFCQKDLILCAKQAGIRTVLIDGTEENAALVDDSVSCFVNKAAKHIGAAFAVFPVINPPIKHTAIDSEKIFVGMGGFDKNNLTLCVLEAINNGCHKAIVAKPINIESGTLLELGAEVYNGDNYYAPMRECGIAITNGGLTMFQALYWGLPTIAVPQYEHQKINIDGCSHCCLAAEPNEEDIADKIFWFYDHSFRNSISKVAQEYIDGRGIIRVCDIIER